MVEMNDVTQTTLGQMNPTAHGSRAKHNNCKTEQNTTGVSWMAKVLQCTMIETDHHNRTRTRFAVVYAQNLHSRNTADDGPAVASSCPAVPPVTISIRSSCTCT